MCYFYHGLDNVQSTVVCTQPKRYIYVTQQRETEASDMCVCVHVGEVRHRNWMRGLMTCTVGHSGVCGLSDTLREGHMLMVSQNWSQRNVLVAKRGGRRGDWRKVHKEKRRDLYSTPNIVRVRCWGHVTYKKEKRNAYLVLMGKPKGRRQLRRPRCRWEDNIKRYLQTQDERAWNGDMNQSRNKCRFLVERFVYLRVL